MNQCITAAQSTSWSGRKDGHGWPSRNKQVVEFCTDYTPSFLSSHALSETVSRGYFHINRMSPQFLNMETKTTVLAYLKFSQLLVAAFLLLGAEVERWKRRHTLIERSMIHVIVLWHWYMNIMVWLVMIPPHEITHFRMVDSFAYGCLPDGWVDGNLHGIQVSRTRRGCS